MLKKGLVSSLSGKISSGNSQDPLKSDSNFLLNHLKIDHKEIQKLKQEIIFKINSHCENLLPIRAFSVSDKDQHRIA